MTTFTDVKPGCEHERRDLLRAEQLAEKDDFQGALFILMFRFPCQECKPIERLIQSKMRKEKA